MAFLISLTYLLLPGHPDLPASDVVPGRLELGLLTVALGLWAWRRGAARADSPRWTPAVVIAAATAVKLVLAFASYPSGWLAQSYENDSWQPPPVRAAPMTPAWLYGSRDATRIDRRLDFRDGTLPAANVTNNLFVDRVDVGDAFSARWTGQFRAFDKLSMTLVLEARGFADLSIDGQPVVAVESPHEDGGAKAEVVVTAGDHVIEVRYRKPANVPALLRLARFDSGVTSVFDDPVVLPLAPADWRRKVAGLLPAAGWMGHGAVLLAFLSWLGPAVRTRPVDTAGRAGAHAATE